MRIGSNGKRQLSKRNIAKVWMKERQERSPDGEQLQIVTVYLSKVEDSHLLFIEK